MGYVLLAHYKIILKKVKNMMNVFEVYHYRYLDGEKVTSIIVTSRNANEVEENFNNRCINIDKLGTVTHEESNSDDVVRAKFNIPQSTNFLH